MSVLLKKEVRLLRPSWIIALLLAAVQGITRPYDFYIASLLFFGLTILALTAMGREASLNTFSSLLAQPAERIRIWKTKLMVLAAAFCSVFFVWLVAFGIAFVRSGVDVADRENSYNLFITICLIAAATFTGGLWTTLLLRQLASAFWLTLLVPVTLSAVFGIFLSGSENPYLVTAVLSLVIGLYSLGGFLFARWLYFRAQDVGWSGVIIAMPEWSFLFARTRSAIEARKRRPVFALIKKELLLQQGVLTGAAGIFILHTVAITLRLIWKFKRGFIGDELTSLVWMLWMVVPPLIGSISFAEERKLGVFENQLCLSASRRTQFIIKFCVTLALAVFFGGVMPALMESIGYSAGSASLMDFYSEKLRLFLYGMAAFSTWTALVSLFASSFSKNFLQAIGIAVVTFTVLALCVPVLAQGHMFFFERLPASSILPMVIAVPTVIVALIWLSYRNFANFRDGWPLWRRTLLGVVVAICFINVATPAVYHRSWEMLEPAEPAHGAAKFSLSNPPELLSEGDNNLVVRLPDGRVWFDYLKNSIYGQDGIQRLWQSLVNPLPYSAGPRAFIGNSPWVEASAGYLDEHIGNGSRQSFHIAGYMDSIGIQKDGSLWVSEKSTTDDWAAKNTLVRFGNESDWKEFAPGRGIASVLLLKQDGTLWEWGTNHVDWSGWPESWPGLGACQPCQLGTNSDWVKLYTIDGTSMARRLDGSVWSVRFDEKTGRNRLFRQLKDYEYIVTQNFSQSDRPYEGAYVRGDGTLWVYGGQRSHGNKAVFETWQCGSNTNWVAGAINRNWVVAIKSDGSLWQLRLGMREYFGHSQPPAAEFAGEPIRLGVHHDWVAVAPVEGGVTSLAADGSLWFWPNSANYNYFPLLIQLPKQPRLIGNVFVAAN